MSIIDKLSEKRIFDVEISDSMDELIFIEGCDNYFECKLNKGELKLLIWELQIMLDKMDSKT